MTDNDPLIALIVLVFFFFALEYFHGPLLVRKPKFKPLQVCDGCNPYALPSVDEGECSECGVDIGLEFRGLRIPSPVHSVFCMRMACNHGSAPDAARVLHWEYLKSLYGSRWALNA